MSKKVFNAGMIIGAVLGGLIAYFYSPHSGKENRKIAKKTYDDFMKMVDKKGFDEAVTEAFGSVTAEGKKLFQTTRKELDQRLKQAYEAVNEMDFEQYEEVVKETVTKIQDETKATKDRMMQIQRYLLAKWHEIKE